MLLIESSAEWFLFDTFCILSGSSFLIDFYFLALLLAIYYLIYFLVLDSLSLILNDQESIPDSEACLFISLPLVWPSIS
jgi:NADH:ubiquinone oxidoreductase subunit 6 (subunit J)